LLPTRTFFFVHGSRDICIYSRPLAEQYSTDSCRNRATAKTKMLDLGSAMDDCNKALKLDASYAKAYNRRAGIEFLMKEYHKV
jgi:hypothetical protein